MEVHVVSKHDISQHATFTLPETNLGALAQSSIRVRSELVGLNSNNLTYAQMGSFLHWWDAYPVSQSYPTPYNDSSQWGIAPAWGFARVMETTISELPVGTLLFGFWPVSGALAELTLQASVPDGQWLEISEHRQKLRTLYNRYMSVSATPSISSIPDLATVPRAAQDELDRLAWTSLLRTLWRAGTHLNNYVFPPSPDSQALIHPYGNGNQDSPPWTPIDGDLSSAVVVNLAASGKTAGVFAHYLQKRRKEQGPLGLLQVTSSVDNIAKAGGVGGEPAFPAKVIHYDGISNESTGRFLREAGAAKIVIADFGARSGGLHQLLNLINQDPALQCLERVILSVGLQQKAYGPDEFLAFAQEVGDLGKVVYDTSSVEDSLIESIGITNFFTNLDEDWQEFLEHRRACFPSLEVVWGHGVSGQDGLEGGWTRLCRGDVSASEGLVYRVQAGTSRAL